MKKIPASKSLSKLFRVAKGIKPSLDTQQKGKEEMALRLLGDGKATFSKAAEITGLDVFSFAKLVKSSRTAWIGTKPDELRTELVRKTGREKGKG